MQQLFIIPFLAGLCLMVNMVSSDSMYKRREANDQELSVQKRAPYIMTEKGFPCAFPFTYKGKQYNECIQGQSKKWCAIFDQNYDEAKEWSYCGPKKLIKDPKRDCVIKCFETLLCTRFDYDTVKGCSCFECPSEGHETPKSACHKKCKAKYCRANWSRDGCECVSCFKPLDTGVTEKQKKLFVDLHNKYRRKVALGKAGQPAAADMTEVVWDDTIAAKAQAWAEMCKFNHSKNGYGENLALTSTIESAVKTWYEEKEHYKYNDRSCNDECGHYTQVVWSNSKKIGCGVAACNSALIVCDYSPAGNYARQPYVSGKACSKCPNGYSTCNNGLCKA